MLHGVAGWACQVKLLRSYALRSCALDAAPSRARNSGPHNRREGAQPKTNSRSAIQPAARLLSRRQKLHNLFCALIKFATLNSEHGCFYFRPQEWKNENKTLIIKKEIQQRFSENDYNLNFNWPINWPRFQEKLKERQKEQRRSLGQSFFVIENAIAKGAFWRKKKKRVSSILSPVKG